ncbi:MAG TPA: Gfo/Idh/MocA family oxidoreductase [Candidatus Cybelea sp.]|nr:Gfo/Idh/MocA family oxidoreductase [Candidatus Cybelea sp.]
MSKALRVLVVGLGNMGMSHAKAYARIDGFEVAGLCERRIADRTLPTELARAPRYADYREALNAVRPDVVSINTWSDSHAEFAIVAMEAGAHVFVEKPLADTVADAERVVAVAKRTGRKLVIGYILRHHPSWIRFIELAKTLGSPLVFRMNLNQQSSGKQWEDHKKLLQSLSPIVDCGVHYLDVMCQITRAKAQRVHGIGARLTDGLPNAGIPEGMYNYGQLQVVFADGSVGWYEAGWGPMMSETAYFVKDVIGPKGSVSIVMAETGGTDTKSADINTHTKTNRILLHHAELAADGSLARRDEMFDTQDEPSHDDLCEREQLYLLKAIREDADLGDHMADAVRSLRIALAADQSVRMGKVVEL